MFIQFCVMLKQLLKCHFSRISRICFLLLFTVYLTVFSLELFSFPFFPSFFKIPPFFNVYIQNPLLIYFYQVEFVKRIRQAHAQGGSEEKVPKVPKEYELLEKVDEKKVKNIYNLGFAKNLWSVLYPPSSRRTDEPNSTKKRK